MMTLSAGTFAAITGGSVLAGSDDTVVTGIAIDSREIQPGAAFMAFGGERVDGHAFVADALARGARAVIVSRDNEIVRDAFRQSGRSDAALVWVEDPQAALEALASWHRERLHCPVIGITGSTGKTTTKDFLHSVLATRLRVVATAGNRNNELGVPLTLLQADAGTQALIVEMAMRGAGQITHLCHIARPVAGLVTNVGVSHIEILGSQEAVASAKGELVRAIPHDGHVFVNGDDAWSLTLVDLADAAVTKYGLGDGCEVTATGISVDGDGHPVFTLCASGGSTEVRLPIPGRHNVYNALAAASVGLWLGIDLAHIAEGLAGATFSKWRMETFLSASGVTVINDAYNANPTSMQAAVDALGDVPTQGRRIAVLGDMAELGSLAELAHFQIGERIATSNTDVLITVGEKGARIADGARAAGMATDAIRPCATADEASEVLDDLVGPGDTVLVKASRVMGLETVVERMMDPRVQPAS